MQQPLITVIIPTYNRETTILNAIKSVLEQTYTNIEVLIIDDGSTDNTEKLVTNVNDKRVTFIKQKNKGACSARNNGILHAKGEYIAFNDSDDIWFRKKLEKQLAVIQKTNADVVFCKLALVSQGKNILMPSTKEGFLNLSKDSLDGIGTQTLIFRKKVLNDFKFNEKMPRLQDFELLLRILESEKYTVYCMNQGLVYYNISSDSISANPQKFEQAVQLIVSSRNNLVYDYPVISKYFSKMFYHNFKYYLRNINVFKMLNNFILAVKYFPKHRNRFF